MRQLGLPPKNAPNCVVMEQKSEEEESGGVSLPHLERFFSLVLYMTTPLEDSFSVFTFKKIDKFRPAKMPIIMIIRFMRY